MSESQRAERRALIPVADRRPVRFTPPPLDPAHRHTDLGPRCWQCGLTIGYYLTNPWKLKCRHCLAINDDERHNAAQSGLVTRAEKAVPDP